MAAVTQTVPNFLGGVSNQPDDKKLPGQVKEALNAYPDPTFGLQKRPGFKFLTQLKETGGSAWDNNDLDNGKWFYYNRDADERYIGCIVGNATPANADIHVWNAIDLTKCTVDHDGTLFRITGDGTGNGTDATLTGLATTTSGSGSGMTVDVTISGGVCTAIKVNAEGNTNYKVGETVTISKNLIPGSGSGSKIDADVTCTIRAREVIGSYLNSIVDTDYDFLTIRDTSIVTIKLKL